MARGITGAGGSLFHGFAGGWLGAGAGPGAGAGAKGDCAGVWGKAVAGGMAKGLDGAPP